MVLRAACHWTIGTILGIVSAGILLADEAGDAREILAASGVKAGLCLHLGCGRQESAGLTAALAENSNFMVHALALDDAALTRAREKIEAKGILGRAMAEKATVNPLPYLSDLANLAVVEDMAALTEQGLTKEEILRVVAPGGVLLVREGGAWAKTVKPRPAEMDEWTHTRHGPDYNPVSQDKLAKLPIGLRWIDGLPMCINGWGSTRGVVIAGGRCFAVTSNERENLGPVRGKINYLVARDAFNGLPLWKINCGPAGDVGAGLNFRNTVPLVTDGQRVYTIQNGKLIAVEAATGRVATTFETKYSAVRLFLLDGVLVASCWEGKAASGDDFDGTSLWPTWLPKSENGSVEAFDAATGRPLWSAAFPAYMLMAADGVVYALTNKGVPATERTVAALELKTGKEKWRVPHTEFGTLAGLQLNICGPGFVVVSQRGNGNSTPMGRKKGSTEEIIEKALFVLSAQDGKVLWKVPAPENVFVALVNGLLWTGKTQRDPITGEVKGALPGMRGEYEMCTPSYLVGDYQLRTRGGTFRQLDLKANPPVFKSIGVHAARGGCIQGMVPANGMFYTAQNNCHCEPGHVYGFLALAPSGPSPGKTDFPKPRPVEKGPAFGALADLAANAADWPTYRHDAERTAATTAKVPEELKEAWKVKVAAPGEGPLAEAWKARLGSSLTPPVVAGGLVFAAAADAGQIVALDAVAGTKVWSAVLGGRVDTPPTIYRGLCVVGCHDGWVYALRAKDGQLAWRTRVAPWERRMVAYGEVESVWPAIGTVLAYDGLLYAIAGRTMESDGGIAVIAMDPATGATVWGKQFSSNGYGSLVDMLYVSNGQVSFVHARMDPKTGANLKSGQGTAQGGMLDGTWTMVGRHRSGNAYRYGRVGADLMAWNDATIVTPSFAITRAKAEKPKAEAQPADAPKPPAPAPAAPAEAKKDAPAAKPPAKPGALTPEDYLWEGLNMKVYQVEAVAMAANVAIYAGRVSDAKKGTEPHFLRAVSLVDGKKLSEIPLDCPPTYDGLALAGEKVFVSLQNGMLMCFGK